MTITTFLKVIQKNHRVYGLYKLTDAILCLIQPEIPELPDNPYPDKHTHKLQRNCWQEGFQACLEAIQKAKEGK